MLGEDLHGELRFLADLMERMLPPKLILWFCLLCHMPIRTGMPCLPPDSQAVWTKLSRVIERHGSQRHF